MLKLVIDTPKLLHRTGLEQREKRPKITAQKAAAGEASKLFIFQ